MDDCSSTSQLMRLPSAGAEVRGPSHRRHGSGTRDREGDRATACVGGRTPELGRARLRCAASDGGGDRRRVRRAARHPRRGAGRPRLRRRSGRERPAARARREQRHRRFAEADERRDIVVVSSILARIAVPGYTGYSASKAGLLGLVRSLAAELAPDNVQVNAICPGWVDTDMAWQGLDLFAEEIGGTRDEAYERAMSEVPLRRMSQPEDIAGTVAWLLSADSRGVTGQSIDHNG